MAIIIEFEVRPDCHEAFQAKLRTDAAQTLRDDGCFRMEILKPFDSDAGKLVLSELWRDDAALDAHRNKPGHSHAWQAPLLHAKRVNRYEVLA